MPFTAGAHIDVQICDGFVRQYSLCNDPSEARRYVIAVLKEEGGRGASLAFHKQITVNSEILISKPRNQFPLCETAAHSLLIGAGIGIAPMLAMAARLRAIGADFNLHYCTRSLEETAFVAPLQRDIEGGNVVLHHDFGDPSQGLNLIELLSRQTPATHLYYCGPPGFMAAAARASVNWKRENVHYEYFVPPRIADKSVLAEQPFVVRLARMGSEYVVPVGVSIIDVLRANAIPVETMCEDGVCGSCKTRYLAGVPEHRDVVLDDLEHESYVMVCCARARSPVLVLDI